MKKITITSLALLFVLVLACRKEKPQFDLSDKDPCGCATEVNADFVIEEQARASWTNSWFTETDTTLRGPAMRFRSKLENAQYHWYIGSQEYFSQDVIINFSSEWNGSDIPITLVVRKEPNSTCFPDDDGYDSITKKFHISTYMFGDLSTDPPTQIWGTRAGLFRVKSEHHSDSIEIGIKYRLSTVGAIHYVSLYNYDGLGTNCIEQLDVQQYNYRETRIFSNQIGCYNEKAVLKTFSDQTCEFVISKFKPDNPNYKQFHYFGRRIGSF